MTTSIPALKKAFWKRQTLFSSEAHMEIPNGAPGRCLNVLTKCARAVTFEVPMGYQDETGFHYGEEPVRTEIRYSADW